MEQQSSISFSPPANRFVVTECERNVLAIMLHSRRAAIRVMEVLDASCFLEVQNQILFTHLINLITETKAAINYYELTFYLSEKNVLSKVGEKYLEAIFDEYVSSSFLEPNLNLILADARKQKLLRLARRITSSVEKNRDYLTICQESQEDINAILSSGRNLDFLLIKDLASAFYDKLNLLSKAETDITGVACGYYEVDNMTKGFQPGELIIIAARPGMGKTSFALNIINNFLNNFHSPVPPSCIFVSLEMPAEQLMARLYGLNTLILLKKFQTGKEITSQE